jgi:hypothetical protein
MTLKKSLSIMGALLGSLSATSCDPVEISFFIPYTDGASVNELRFLVHHRENATYSYGVSLDGKAVQCDATDDGYNTVSFFCPNALPEGPHTVEISATDAIGQTAHATRNFILNLPLRVSVQSPTPDQVLTSPNGSIVFSVAGGALSQVSYICGFDSTTVPCSSPYAYTGLADGQHFFVVTAIDSTDNNTSEELTFTVKAGQNRAP